MILISHRGNVNGPIRERENTYEYILEALTQGYQVEIDVWFVDDKFKLGHDEPGEDFPFTLLENYSDKLWIHCKNVEALSKLNEIDKIGTKLNYFWHDVDRGVLTSKGYIWSIEPIERGILVMPEMTCNDPVPTTLGICSDYVGTYR